MMTALMLAAWSWGRGIGSGGDGSNLKELMIWLVALVVVAAFGWWVLKQFELPPIVAKLATIIFVLIAIIVLLNILFSL